MPAGGRVQNLRNRVHKARQELTYDIDDQGPTVAAIVEHMGLSAEDISLGGQALNRFSVLPLGR